MGATWAQVGPMLAQWNLLSGEGHKNISEVSNEGHGQASHMYLMLLVPGSSEAAYGVNWEYGIRTWSSHCPQMSQYISTILFIPSHYHDVIMGVIASQITSVLIVYLTVYSGAHQRKHQSSASLAFVRGIHRWPHYSDVIIGTMASKITSLTIVYSIVYSSADQRKHQNSMSLAFVRGIHRSPVNSPHKGPVTRKIFQSDDVIMGRHNADYELRRVFFQVTLAVVVSNYRSVTSWCHPQWPPSLAKSWNSAKVFKIASSQLWICCIDTGHMVPCLFTKLHIYIYLKALN